MRLKVQLTRRVFFTLAGFVAVANAGVLLLPEAFGAKQGEKREVLRVASSQEFDNLNPLIGTMSAATYAHALFDRSQLTILNAENQWVAQAAERIPTVENGDVVFVKENGSEKMKVSWRIRKEAKWGDGKPLSGADYKFAWEVGRSAFVSVPAKEPFDSIESIEIDASDAKRFTMTFKERKWDYYMLDAIHALPVHIEGKVFEKHGNSVEGYDRNTGYKREMTAMKRSKPNPGLKLLTETELEFMQIVWSEGEATVRDVMKNLSADRNLAYTSVSTIMRILEKKGVLRSRRGEGNSHVYVPVLQKAEYESASLSNLLTSVFSGTPSTLVRTLVDTSDLKASELEEIRKIISDRLKE